MYIYILYNNIKALCILFILLFIIACIFIILLLFNLKYTAHTFTAFIPNYN